MVFDPAAWEVPATDLFRRRQDWDYSVYGCDGLKEELSAHMPTPLGKTMRMHVYVDSDHAGDSLTRRSRTGFVVFLNSASIFWFSKRQTSSCETSTLGSEFITVKTACVRLLRQGLMLQTSHDGHSSRRADVHLQGQPMCPCQHVKCQIQARH